MFVFSSCIHAEAVVFWCFCHVPQLLVAVMDRWPSFSRFGFRKVPRLHRCSKWRQLTRRFVGEGGSGARDFQQRPESEAYQGAVSRCSRAAYHRAKRKLTKRYSPAELILAMSWLSLYPKTINLILAILLSLFVNHAKHVHRFFVSMFVTGLFFQRHCSHDSPR